MCRTLFYLISFVLLLSMAGQTSVELILHQRLDEGSGNFLRRGDSFRLVSSFSTIVNFMFYL